MPRARLVLALVFAVGLALASGCNGIPSQVEGSVRYRDDLAKNGGGGKLIEIRTDAPRAPTATASAAPAAAPPPAALNPAVGISADAETILTPAEMSTLLLDLDRAGLFALPGRSDTPRNAPPGSIVVDTTARKFTITLADLRAPEDGARFGNAVSRIVLATQVGPHYSLPR